MAANGVATVKYPIDIGQPYQSVPLGVTVGASPTVNYLHQGIRTSHGVTTAIYHIFRIPSGGATLTTGLTLELLLCCDIFADNADLGGTVGYFDFVVGTLTDGTSIGDDGDLTGGTLAAQVGSWTAPTAVGKLKKLSIVNTIANATNANAAIAAGLWCVARVRRLGTNASDTNTGIIIVAGLDIYAY